MKPELIFLLKLAWESRIRLPFLIMSGFMALGLRIQMEINIDRTSRFVPRLRVDDDEYALTDGEEIDSEDGDEFDSEEGDDFDSEDDEDDHEMSSLLEDSHYYDTEDYEDYEHTFEDSFGESSPLSCISPASQNRAAH